MLSGYKIAKISSFASNLPHLALWLLFLWLICLGQHECTQVEKYYSVMRHASSSWSRLRFILCIYINRYVYLCIYSVAVKFPPCSPAIKKSILHASLQSSHPLTLIPTQKRSTSRMLNTSQIAFLPTIGIIGSFQRPWLHEGTVISQPLQSLVLRMFRDLASNRSFWPNTGSAQRLSRRVVIRILYGAYYAC